MHVITQAREAETRMLKGQVAQQANDAMTRESSIRQLQQQLADRESCVAALRQDMATAEETHKSAVQVHSMVPARFAHIHIEHHQRVGFWLCRLVQWGCCCLPLAGIGPHLCVTVTG